MRDIVFATVNGKKIIGQDILACRKRIASESQVEDQNFASTPNEENNSYLNAEALQRLITYNALVALAKFQGVEVSEDDISQAIYELRNSYEDEIEWETSLDDLGIDDRNMRDVFYIDMMIDRLLQSNLEHFDEPDNHKAEEFYHQNQESMKIADTYTFIEIEVSDTSYFKLAATILSQSDTDSILKEAKNHHLEATLNDDIPFQQLPEPLQEAFKDLQEQKIGTIPLDEGTIVFVKLLRKIEGKKIALEDAIPGLIEYLKYQQYSDVLDELSEKAIENCDIEYKNAEFLKELK